ncbi:AMP-binding protein [Streptomyces sp. NPDC048441]|uniref:AMP-binding protein n=1 Tax=Streptomyces sp. NPDC048441 TaxID=3365552 RepID=UPI003711853E
MSLPSALSHGGSATSREASATPRLLDDWFREGLARNPSGAALLIHDREWSYIELDRTARRYAAALSARHRPRRVGILAGKSVEAYAGFLAALYTGAAAVPLSTEAPLVRNLAIAAAAGVDALVVDAGGADQCASLHAAVGHDAPLVAPALPHVPPLPENGAEAYPDTGRSSDDAAYVLFTSGSTGRPKGVPISHRNVDAFLCATLPRYELGPGDCFSQVYDLTFDLSVFEVWPCWSSGARLRVLTRLQALDPARWVSAHGITVWTATPSLAAAVTRRGGLRPGDLGGLRYSVFCGEPLHTTTARSWRRAAPSSVLDNLYGPTELTVACTAYRWAVDADAPWPPEYEGGTVPVGEPHQELAAMLLGADGEPHPEQGELCVTGPQMFSGYLEQDQNQGRFVARDGATWYRTGDLLRRDARAGLVHLGRVDQQVKVRGYRVELGEVEQALTAVAGSPCAVLLAEGSDGPVLAAFVTVAGASSDEPRLDTATVRERLAEQLPGYMLPTWMWPVEHLPLTANGKTDRGSLSADAVRRLSQAEC